MRRMPLNKRLMKCCKMRLSINLKRSSLKTNCKARWIAFTPIWGIGRATTSSLTV
nr:MAG TPA: IMS family HHH motif [Caudoviricetes sp.]